MKREPALGQLITAQSETKGLGAFNGPALHPVALFEQRDRATHRPRRPTVEPHAGGLLLGNARFSVTRMARAVTDEGTMPKEVGPYRGKMSQSV